MALFSKGKFGDKVCDALTQSSNHPATAITNIGLKFDVSRYTISGMQFEFP